MPREWVLPVEIDVLAALREAVSGHALVATLLARRGIVDPQRARAHLDPTLYAPASPYDLPGVELAVSRLCQAASGRRRVRIWGDFDADGQTATAVLFEALQATGAMVDYQLPHRDEGHGLHLRAIEEALRDGVSVLVTCDTGIGDADVVAKGVGAGLTVIVTDHHDLPKLLPPAHAIVDSIMLPAAHPLRELSGVGVAYMLACALLEGSANRQLLEGMLDLVALGLVADVARQVDDVRYLTQRGLAVLRATCRPGVRALIGAAGLDIAHLTELDISYQLGPRLNAAGRLAKSELAVRLLLTRDEAEAQSLAEALEELNRDRQRHTRTVMDEVSNTLRAYPELARQSAIVVEGQSWEAGVLGLVASDLARSYGRPAILIAHREGAPSVGSARSVEGIDIHEAIAAQRAHLIREGGHPMAAGFSVERRELPAFRRGLLEWLAQRVPPRGVLPPLPVDAEVPWGDIGFGLARQVARLAPFGAGNPRPVLAAMSGTVVRMEDVSHAAETPHVRLHLDDEQGRPLRLVWFNAGEAPALGEVIDVAFHIGTSYWRNREQLQLELVDWRPAEMRLAGRLVAITAGREVVDWRAQGDVGALVANLRSTYGPRLALWAEGLANPPEGASMRCELGTRGALALAILTSPPGPEELRSVVDAVQPQVVYLLPPQSIPQPSAEQFVERVAGMLRVALARHGGLVDVPRMAARIAARTRAVVAALRGLEAAGKVVLSCEAGTLRASLPGPAAPQSVPAEEQPPQGEDGLGGSRQQAQEQARSALTYLLRETRAYRLAYATLAVEALFGSAP